jgi:hypothetical protein
MVLNFGLSSSHYHVLDTKSSKLTNEKSFVETIKNLNTATAVTWGIFQPSKFLAWKSPQKLCEKTFAGLCFFFDFLPTYSYGHVELRHEKNVMPAFREAMSRQVRGPSSRSKLGELRQASLPNLLKFYYGLFQEKKRKSCR